MDAHALTVLIWVSMGGAGFAAGLVGLATTRRRMEQPVAGASAPDRAVVAH